MLLMLEAWTRQAVSTHRGVAAQQKKLQQAAVLLIQMIYSHRSAQICSGSKGEPSAASAEIRVQLSVIVSIFKMRDVIIESSLTDTYNFLWFLELCSHLSKHGGLPPHGRAALQRLSFSQLFMLSVQPQPGLDWGATSASDPSQLGPSRSFTSSLEPGDAYLEPSILSHSIHLLHRQTTELLVRDTILDASLSSCAIAILTSGPVWSLFHAASRVGLHPYGRLISHYGFSDDHITHVPTHNAVYFFGGASSLLLGLLLRGGDTLACVTAAHALLHSEVLDCLVGQLWHVGIPVGRHTQFSSDSNMMPPVPMPQRGGGSPAASPQPRTTVGIVYSGLRRALAFSYGFFWNTLYAWAGWNSAGGGEAGEEQSEKEEEACDDWVAVGHLLLGAFTNLSNAMRHACSHREGLIEEGSPELDAFCSRLEVIPLTSLALECASPPLFFFDVLNRAEVEAMEAGMSTLSQMRSLVTELLTMLTAASARRQPEGAAAPSEGRTWSRWEVLQAALLRSLPLEQQEDWGRPLGCCNPGCTNLSGPSELQLKTKACGGGCGVRYCSKKCSKQGWKLGHKHSCKLMQRQ